MAQVAFVIDIPDYKQASLGDFVATGYDLARRIGQDYPAGGRPSFVSVAKSDSRLVPDAYASATIVTNPVVARTGTVTHSSLTIAGGAAGDHTVAGILTTDELVSVVHVDDTTHAGTDKTSEYTISANGTVNNTGGTSSASNHVVVSWRRV